MSALLTRRLVIVWLALSTITVVYLFLDRSVDERGTLQPSSAVTTGAIVLALVKVRLIFREFMEVRHAPTLLRRLTDIWVVVIGVALLGSYFVGLAVH